MVLALLARLPDSARAHVAGLYRDTLEVQVPLLSSALSDDAQRDGGSAQALAHKLAGSAAMMQDAPLSQLARAMEHALLAGDPQSALALLPALESCAANSLAGLGAANTRAAAG